MQAIFDAVTGLGPWAWLVLAVVMVVLETVVPGVHFMWFGLAAAVIGALLFAYPLPVPYQLVAFAVLSLVAILIARRWWGPERLKSDVPDLNVRGQQYVGRVVTVEEAIASGQGKVRVGDTLWVAEGPDAAAGAKVKVTGVNGTRLVVAAG